MASIFKRKGRDAWYIHYTDGTGRRKMVKGSTDKKVTEAIARKLEQDAMLRRRGVIDSTADKLAAAAQKPLAEHLEDFKKSLDSKDVTPRYIRETKSYIETTFKECSFDTLDDLDVAKIQAFIADQKKAGKGFRTINARLTALKSFTRWLWRMERLRTDPMTAIKKLNVKKDPRHPRRALTEKELKKLFATTFQAPARFGMTGPERALLYRLAVESGLRAGELRSLVKSSFDLKNNLLVVQAAYSKRRRQDVISLLPDTTRELKALLKNKTAKAPAFNMPNPDRVVKMFRADLKDAKIPYVKSERYADFHSLRYCTGSLLAAAGVYPKVAQTLMRHSDINLTMNLYTHVLNEQEREALAKLPDFSKAKNNGSVLASAQGA